MQLFLLNDFKHNCRSEALLTTLTDSYGPRGTLSLTCLEYSRQSNTITRHSVITVIETLHAH